jgi:tRNA-dihydrouridine synthase 3
MMSIVLTRGYARSLAAAVVLPDPPGGALGPSGPKRDRDPTDEDISSSAAADDSSAEKRAAVSSLPVDGAASTTTSASVSSSADAGAAAAPAGKGGGRVMSNRRAAVEGGREARGLCAAVVAGQPCRFGERCRFSHDLDGFIRSRPADLGTVCVNIVRHGRCPFGIRCRFASGHPPVQPIEPVAPTGHTLNVLDKSKLFELDRHQREFPRSEAYMLSLPPEQRGQWKPRKAKPSTYRRPAPEAAAATKSEPADAANAAPEPPSAGIASSTTEASKGACEVNPYGREEARMADVAAQVTSVNVLDALHGLNRDSGRSSVALLDGARVRPSEKKRVDFRDKLYLAPLTTVGNLPFRRVCKALGCDITCGEMSMTIPLLQGSQSEWALLRRHSSEDVFGVQIAGGYVDTVTAAVELINAEAQVDFIDLNCGCPIDLVCNKGSGSSLMEKGSRMQQLLRGMVSVSDCAITVKMRTGYSRDEDKRNAHALIPTLLDTGVSLITVHGRTREQRYSKSADWDYIERCAQAAGPIPLFGNGDIISWEDYEAARSRTSVAGCLIARYVIALVCIM